MIDELRNLRDFLDAITAKMDAVERMQKTAESADAQWKALRKAFPVPANVCGICGLPRSSDMDHDPPECPRPKDGPMAVFHVYNNHQQQLYTTKITGMPNQELVRLWIPTRLRYTQSLQLLVSNRILEVEAFLKASAPDRWDYINDPDRWGDDAAP